jgi:hypothetical protein
VAFNSSAITELTLPPDLSPSIVMYSKATGNAVRSGVFSNCQRLSKVNIEAKLSVLPEEMFQGCGNLSEVILPDTLREIGHNAFADCGNLNYIDLPDSVQKIGRSTFSRTALISVTLPSSIQVIEIFAFFGCKSLKDVIIPESVKRIQFTSGGFSTEAFFGCENLSLQSKARLNSVGYRINVG